MGNNHGWKDEYWGPKGTLVIQGKRLREKVKTDPHVYSELSSLCYSATGNARARFRQAPYKLWWLPRALFLMKQAEHFSDKLVLLVTFAHLTINELEIRQTVLRKTVPSRPEEAQECIDRAFVLIQKGNEVLPHVVGLLHIGQADLDLHAGRKKKGETNLLNAFACAVEAGAKQPQQASRIFRHIYRMGSQLKKPSDLLKIKLSYCRNQAEELARKSGATDQLRKQGKLVI